MAAAATVVVQDLAASVAPQMPIKRLMALLQQRWDAMVWIWLRSSTNGSSNLASAQHHSPIHLAALQQYLLYTRFIDCIGPILALCTSTHARTHNSIVIKITDEDFLQDQHNNNGGGSLDDGWTRCNRQTNNNNNNNNNGSIGWIVQSNARSTVTVWYMLRTPLLSATS